MKRNSFLLFVAILFTSVSVSFAQKKLSILGDSYSTYYGYVTPDTNLCWYGVPEEKRENDVKRWRIPGGIFLSMSTVIRWSVIIPIPVQPFATPVMRKRITRIVLS